jgi:acetolactate synthase-1/2/3 large subunit
MVRDFCKRTGIPSVSTMMGTGLFLPGHPLHYGMVGQSGFRTANAAVGESDLLVLIGARVSDRAIGRPSNLEGGATIVHIDVDPAEIGKNLSTTIPLVGDIAEILPELAKHDCGENRKCWTAHLDALRGSEEREVLDKRPADGFVEPNAFVRMLCGKLPPGSIYIADVGQNQIWSAKNYRAPGRFMTTGGMGTMGYSIPAALGAKLARPDKTVIAVCGDGAVQMSMNELGTMRQHGAAVKIVVMRNGVLGMVREIQKNAYGGREFAIGLEGSPDFGLIAQAYGMQYFFARGNEEAEHAAGAMLALDGPALLVCDVDPKEATA